ncbi:MAG: DUF333 domain-containing protein [Candidatus Micrarchaeia archaeon]
MKLLFVLGLISILLFAGCTGAPATTACTAEAKQCPDGSYVGRNASNNCEFDPCPQSNNSQIANPASVNCVDKGYKLEIRKDASGGEVGYCVFGNGRECEEWAFYRGECGLNGTTVRQPAKEGEFCGGIAGFACESGLSCKLDGNYPDAGGKCVKQAPEFTDCPVERGEVCTMEYSPVCGRHGATPSTIGYATYGNMCVACSKSSPATSYVQGTCEELNLTEKGKEKGVLYDCPAERADACAEIYDPVCGRMVDPSSSASFFRDYASPCAACAKGSNAIAYYVGTCEAK